MSNWPLMIASPDTEVLSSVGPATPVENAAPCYGVVHVRARRQQDTDDVGGASREPRTATA